MWLVCTDRFSHTSAADSADFRVKTRDFCLFLCTSMSLCSHRIPFFWSVGSRISSFSQRLLRDRALPHNVLFPRHYSVVSLHSSSAIDCAAFWSTTLSDPVCISSSFSARPHALWLPSLFTGALISSWDLLLFAPCGPWNVRIFAQTKPTLYLSEACGVVLCQGGFLHAADFHVCCSAVVFFRTEKWRREAKDSCEEVFWRYIWSQRFSGTRPELSSM